MLSVHPIDRSQGVLRIDGTEFACALGRGGVRVAKREGDGATPLGTFPLRRAFYRADRLAPPASGLPVRALTENDGWCDDPAHDHYNQLVALPFAASHEALWREDGLYDIIIVIGHNDDPPQPRLGSAIFIHCASADFAPTEGCIALERRALIDILPQLSQAMPLRITDSRVTD